MAEKRIAVVMRGIVVATLFVSLWVWLAALVRRFDPALGIELPRWLRPLGTVLLVAGLGLAGTCVGFFVTVGRGTPAPFDPPRVFVARGPYRFVRNPMYVGAVTALVGGALAFGSMSILVLAAVFWGLSHLMVVFNEEPALERRFGDSYAEYRRQVNRWLPRA